MSLNGISRTAKVIATGLVFLTVLVGMQFYVVRELLVELMFFCILVAAIEIAVGILLVIAEASSRFLLWFRAHIALAGHHLQHATAVIVAKQAIHSRPSAIR
jgi:hypothetical protein